MLPVPAVCDQYSQKERMSEGAVKQAMVNGLSVRYCSAEWMVPTVTCHTRCVVSLAEACNSVLDVLSPQSAVEA